MKNLLIRLGGLFIIAAAVLFAPTAASAHETCESAEDVPMVLEFGSLGGQDKVVCAQHSAGKTALEGLESTGTEVVQTTGTMPMVCRIDGQPTKDKELCTDKLTGDGYWAFMVAKEGKPWGYASTGMGEYKLAEGDFVALVYHLMADGQDVPVKADADAQTRAAAVVPSGDHDGNQVVEVEVDSTGVAVSGSVIVLIALAAILGAAAIVIFRRRK